jgi:HSP20 family molecular chaperone IbpA
MLVPRRRNFDLFDDFFDDGFFTKHDNQMMKTDIREKENEYLIDIELPGFKKDNIDLSLNQGYLTVSAKVENENNADEDNFIRRERYYGECSRSFYVGEDIEETDIDAEFKDGVLKLIVPKKEEAKKLPETKKIEIK